MRSGILLVLLACSALAAEVDEPDRTHAQAQSIAPTFNDLFRRASLRHVALSPNGEFIAFFRDYMLVMGRPGEGYSDVRGFHSRLWLEELTWIGPNTVWVESWDPTNQRQLGTVVRFEPLEDGGYGAAEVRDHRNPGYISDYLRHDDSRIVLARPEFEDDSLTADLYRINVFEPLDEQLKKHNRIDTGSEDFFYYAQNSSGAYTLGVRLAEGVPEVWRKLPDGESWEQVWVADKESSFMPWAMSEDARTLWVLSNAQTDRVAAVEFDIESREFSEILFEHERVDVDSIMMSEDGSTPIGVTYMEQGLVRYEFFAEEESAVYEQLQSHFPNQGVILTGYSEDSDVRLVFVSSPTDSGAVHVCHLRQDTCLLVESIAPWLEGKPLQETIAMDVPSTDGLVVEAFLTLPPETDEKIPLVALPHGGPIGVSDDRYFSSEVQWLALNGYAILQVNYRGSGGYGEGFTQAGLREWGRGIEDDVEAAIYKVLDEYPQIDGDRVGVFGASYGGYSAMMSVIRNPELFKCAASFAGVMDLTLLFTESARARSKHVREVLTDYVGDPDIDYDEQVEHSPVYRYKDITRPVLLGHGLDDDIVDFEHSWRMQKMLRLAGRPPEFILLKKVGHGFSYISEAEKFYQPLVEFLDTHLKPPPENATPDDD